MKQNYFFILLFLFCSVLHAQTVLTIKGANNSAPTFFINNGAYLYVSGGINVDQASSPSNLSNQYLQNNGTIKILSDSTPGQSNFTNNVAGLNTYSSGQTTGEVIFAANNETQSITGSGTVEFQKLTTNNTQSPTLDLQQNVTVDGNFTLGGATAVINSSTFVWNGNYFSNGALTGSASSNLTINGSGNLNSAVSFSAGSKQLQSLTLNRANSSGHTVVLGTDLAVSGTLTLTSGILNLQANNLTLPSSALLTGTPYSSNNMIQADGTGQFIRGVNTGVGTFLFPIGDGTPAYSPATINFVTNATVGDVGVNLKPSAHPQINNPTTATDYLKRYWAFSNTGITTYTFTASFDYLPADIVGTEAAIKANRWSNPWSAFTQSSASSNILTITGILNESQAPLSGDFTGRNILCNVAAGNVTASHDTTCAGTQELLSTNGYTGTVQWQFSINGNTFLDIDGADSADYTTAALSQTIYYRVFATNNICHDSSAAIKLVVNPLPIVPTLNPSETKICPSDSAQICTQDTYTAYLWNTGATTSCIQVREAQDYWLTVSDVNNCSVWSPHISLATYPEPSVSIVQRGDTLYSLGQVSYQWYKDDFIIQGATSSFYVVQSAGSYAVEVTDTNGCKAKSSALIYTGINELSADLKFSIYPNPVSLGTLHVSISKELESCTLQIFDISGRELHSVILSKEKTEIDVSTFAAGFYSACLKQNNKLIAVDRFIKQ